MKSINIGAWGKLSTLFLISLLCSCTANRTPNAPDKTKQTQEGESFTVEMGGFGSNTITSNLRAENMTINGIEDIKSLRLLIFDGEGKFLYTREAVLEGTEDVSSKSDDDFLPLKNRKEIKQAKKFKVTLIKSSQKHRIHFIANYNWQGFEQDYFLAGASEGGLISALQTTRPNFKPMWACLELSALDENTLKDKVVVLLRNYAEISIDASGTKTFSETFGSLEVTRFSVCNYPKKGTVAPFIYTSSHKYEFKYNNPEATVIPGVEIEKGDKETDFVSVNTPFPLHEWDNKNHNLFLIIEGNRTDKSGRSLGKRYYKLDIVSRREDGTKEFLPILRNHQYKIIVEKVLSDGYESLEKAIAAPAGNNVFASVEFQDFPSVSDGVIHLDVSPIVTYAVKPTTLSFNVLTNQGTPIYIPRWETGDPHMGELQKTSTGFNVQVKSLPEGGYYKEYLVDVVVKGGQGTIVTRTVRITLRPPFNFNATLTNDNKNTAHKILTFDLSEYLSPGILPFNVWIEATNLTPLNDDPAHKLLLTFYNRKIYYVYSLRDPALLGKKISLKFTENRSGQTSSLVLSSTYHNDQIVTLP